MAQFNDKQSCCGFHLELGKETFQLKGKELMGYVSEQVKLWSDKCLLAQQREEKREAAERAVEREAALARETAEREASERAAEREAALVREAA